MKKSKKKNEDYNPELDIDANIIMKTGVIESVSVYAKNQRFNYKNFEYHINPEYMILTPTRDTFKPFYVFKENQKEPYDFKNYNKKIPSRVLTLLYNIDTYRLLIQFENKNLNLILVILGIITLGILIVYGWLNFGGGEIPPIPFISG